MNNPRPIEETEIISFRLPQAMHEDLRVLSDVTDISISQMVREAISLRLQELREDPQFQQAVAQKIGELQTFIALSPRE